jgi:hypothetical protein
MNFACTIFYPIRICLITCTPEQSTFLDVLGRIVKNAGNVHNKIVTLKRDDLHSAVRDFLIAMTWKDKRDDIDKGDMSKNRYTVSRRTRWWAKACFFHLLDLTALNSYYCSNVVTQSNRELKVPLTLVQNFSGLRAREPQPQSKPRQRNESS